jgi:hypothetical protein
MMMGDTTVAESWSHLGELLFEGSWDERLSRFRSRAAFRGDGRAGRELTSSLVRLGGDAGQKERHLIRNFRKYARRSFVGDDSVWNWLALAQHHGLPTRLLDWTYSPYIALHFATDLVDDFEQDAQVWIVSFQRANRGLPTQLSGLLEEEGSDVFTGEMLSRVTPTVETLDRLSPEPFVLFLEPPSLDDRIVNQSALFSVMSGPHSSLEDWLRGNPGAARRIVIPARLKWEIRDKLDQANITERVLFPGLDGLSAWLRRYYTTPRHPG